MTDDLNKEWAELERWIKEEDFNLNEYTGNWRHPNENVSRELPDWTEPNRFFAEVVPRMRELGFNPYPHARNGGWLPINQPIHPSWCQLCLKAAIQARRELGK